MPRSISAPTIAGSWSRARPATAFASSTRSPASSGWARASRPPAASATRRSRARSRRSASAATRCANRGVTRARLIATEACRAAENGGEFRARVAEEVGLELEIVDRETEATLAATGCTPLIDPDADGVILFDIGGGSSELVRLGRSAPARRGPPLPEIEAWASLPLGVVTLAERYGGARRSRRDIYEAMIEEVAGASSTASWPSTAAPAIDRIHLLGTSGTVTTIAGVHLDLQRYDRRRVDGCWMSDDEVDRAWSSGCCAMSYEERVANPCIGAERADLVLAGCAILDAIRRAFPCRRLRVADRGLREGMLVQMMRADGVWGDGAAAASDGAVTTRSGGRDLKARVKTGKGRSLSSKLWLERQLNDPYVARAKREGYRSRAAYKLIEIDDKHRLLKPGARVVDLGAAPGGWSQVAAKRVGAADGQGPRGRDRSPRHGRRSRASSSCSSISSIRRAPDRLKAMLGGPADVVLSDMAANATGHRKTDHLRIMALAEAAAEFAREVLAPGGAFLCKVLQGGTEAALLGAAQARLRQREARQAGGEPRGFGRALSAGDGISRTGCHACASRHPVNSVQGNRSAQSGTTTRRARQPGGQMAVLAGFRLSCAGLTPGALGRNDNRNRSPELLIGRFGRGGRRAGRAARELGAGVGRQARKDQARAAGDHRDDEIGGLEIGGGDDRTSVPPQGQLDRERADGDADRDRHLLADRHQRGGAAHDAVVDVGIGDGVDAGELRASGRSRRPAARRRSRQTALPA